MGRPRVLGDSVARPAGSAAFPHRREETVGAVAVRPQAHEFTAHQSFGAAHMRTRQSVDRRQHLEDQAAERFFRVGRAHDRLRLLLADAFPFDRRHVEQISTVPNIDLADNALLYSQILLKCAELH